MLLLSSLLIVLLFLSVGLLIALWEEKEDYRKWFEASKEYETYQHKGQYIKVNKDGSIAKKRGRPTKKESK